MNPESLEAYESSDKQRIRERVYEAILEAGSDGLTSDELATTWNVRSSDISSRFSDLKKAKRIHQIGRWKTRTGGSAGVHAATQALAV